MVDPQFLQLDYGAPVHISEVQILWQTACAKNFTIDVSDDAATWTTIKTVTGNTAGIGGAGPTAWSGTGYEDLTGLSGVGRYMRMNGTARCGMYGYSIWEIRAFGDTNASCTP
jgi:hypothetical protein